MKAIKAVLGVVWMLYAITVGIAVPYYNWQFAREQGFLKWLFLGEIVPTAKGLVWPYFVFSHEKSQDAQQQALQPLSWKQMVRMEAKKCVASLNASQQATYLINMEIDKPHQGLKDYANIEDIVAYRRKALSIAEQVDTDTLNKIYPELGTRFRSDFAEALRLFLMAYEKDSQSVLEDSQARNNRWADWYTEHRIAIEEAINSEPH